MEKTIEQRAIECCMTQFPNHETADAESMRIGYIQGATDQQKIDIDKACKWLYKNRQNYDYINTDGDVYDLSLIKDFKKAMEE